MPATNITSSSNIASLDSKIIVDLCTGLFYIDLTPTIYIGSGEDNVLGAKYQITNPFNVVVRAYPSSYDITPVLSGGMQSVTSFSVPTQANNFQYGNYIIEAQLTDADGTNYKVSKTISICAPNPLDKSKKYGTIGAKLSGICSAGKVYVAVDSEPTYKGFISGSADRSFTLDFPTGSGKSSITTVQPSFNVQLFEGVYDINGTSCASYYYGDNVTVKIQYKLKFSKNILCSLDECCVFAGLQTLNDKLNSDCSDQEKIDTQNDINQAGLLLNSIDYGSRCGEDVSDYISQLEDVLKVSCSCTFNDATPIINNNPSEDIIIQGCNITSETTGLTTTYTINAYSYIATVTDNGGALTVTDVVVNDCIQSQSFTFNISVVYSQIKNLANTNLSESQFWASVINKSLKSLDTDCLGINNTQLQTTRFDELFQSIINKACQGGNCDAIVNSSSATQQGGNVLLSWTETYAYSIDIYIDGLFYINTLASVTSYVLLNYSDGLTHTYLLSPKCQNGSNGTALNGTFGFTGCPTINPPMVSSNNVSNATCPYDLTGLVSSLPTGITEEWHNANNTLSSSLVGNPTSVADGIYYVFATNGSSCYSTSVKVILTCAVSSSCTAPQNLSVSAIIGGLKISFASAAYPPPSNSYTVKRKAASDPDIDGSYTSLGNPTYNVSTGKWEKTDTTATANTLYTYKAQSNCLSSTPYVIVNFANISCPSITLTSSQTDVGYSFTPIGGQVDKYEVQLYDSSGVTLLHTDTYLPSFSSPITGTFSYLSPGITYQIRLVIFIGTYSVSCAFVSKMTIANNYYLSASFNFSIDSVTGAGVPTLAPTGVNGSVNGYHTAMSGTYNVTVSGTIILAIRLDAYVNGTVVSTVNVPSAGTYSLTISAASTDLVSIAIDS